MAINLDFTLEPGVTPVLVLNPHPPAYAQMIAKMERNKELKVIKDGLPEDVFNFVKQLGSCVVLCHTSKQEDLIKVMTMLKQVRSFIQRGMVRVVITSKFKEQPILDRFKQLLVAEVIPEPLQEKSLFFKFDRHVKIVAKSVQSQLKTDKPGAGGKARGEGGVVGGAGKAGGGKGSKNNEVKMVDANHGQFDFWIAINAGPNSGAKLVGSSWTIRMSGPGPMTGRWNLLEGQGSGEEKVFQWVPNNPLSEQLINQEGSWIFRGTRLPEFIEGQNLWFFTGPRPSLQFVHEGNAVAAKFKLDADGSMLLAKDSDWAVKSRPVLVQTWAVVLKTKDSEKQAQAEKDAEAKAAAVAEGQEASSVKMVDPLTLDSDCWIFFENNAKKVLEKWTVRLIGPPTAAGNWVAAEISERPKKKASGGNARREEPWWKWMPADPNDKHFQREEGMWFFQGMQPRFRDPHWIFVSRQPTLGFYAEREILGAKFAMGGPNELHVAKDSAQARKLIREYNPKLNLEALEKETDEEKELALKKLNNGAEAATDDASVISDDSKAGAADEDEAARLERLMMDPEAEELESLDSEAKAQDEDGESEVVAAESASEETSDEESVEATSTDADADEDSDEAQVKSREEDPSAEEVEGSVEAASEESEGKKKSAQAAEEDVPEYLKREKTEEELAEEDKPRSSLFDEETPAEEEGEGPPPGGETAKFHYPVEHFGEVAGNWVYAARGASKKKLYVHIPKDLEPGTQDELEMRAPFWVFAGDDQPTLTEDGKQWEFVGYEPVDYVTFKMLPRPVQDYLKANFVKAPEEIQEAVLGEEIEGEIKGEEESPELSATTQEEKGTELEGEIEADKEREGEDATQEAKEPTEFSGMIAAELEKADPELREKAEEIQKGLKAPAEVAEKKPKSKKEQEEILQKASQKLGPLGIGFLMSELMHRRDLSLKEVSERYCKYVSSSVGGLRAELWLSLKDEWHCVATYDGSEGKFKVAVQTSQGGAQRLEPQWLGSPAVMGTILGLKGEVLGVVAVAGSDVAEVTNEFILGAGEMAVGVLRSWAREIAAGGDGTVSPLEKSGAAKAA